jgi:hypothetical protein
MRLFETLEEPVAVIKGFNLSQAFITNGYVTDMWTGR